MIYSTNELSEWRRKSFNDKLLNWLSTPSGVDFTNIFTRRFYARSSQKRKSKSSRQYLFTLLGSARVKAVRRTLMKLSPGLWAPLALDLKIIYFYGPEFQLLLGSLVQEWNNLNRKNGLMKNPDLLSRGYVTQMTSQFNFTLLCIYVIMLWSKSDVIYERSLDILIINFYIIFTFLFDRMKIDAI